MDLFTPVSEAGPAVSRCLAAATAGNLSNVILAPLGHRGGHTGGVAAERLSRSSRVVKHTQASDIAMGN